MREVITGGCLMEERSWDGQGGERGEVEDTQRGFVC